MQQIGWEVFPYAEGRFSRKCSWPKNIRILLMGPFPKTFSGKYDGLVMRDFHGKGDKKSEFFWSQVPSCDIALRRKADEVWFMPEFGGEFFCSPRLPTGKGGTPGLLLPASVTDIQSSHSAPHRPEAKQRPPRIAPRQPTERRGEESGPRWRKGLSAQRMNSDNYRKY